MTLLRPLTHARRYAAVIALRPESEPEYRALHASVWPGVLNNLRAAHVGNYSIFLRDGLLFSYLEYTGGDYDADMSALATQPETRRWRQIVSSLQHPVVGADPGQWWAPMTEVFHFE